MQEQSIQYPNIFHAKVTEWTSKVGTHALGRHSTLGSWYGVSQLGSKRQTTSIKY